MLIKVRKSGLILAEHYSNLDLPEILYILEKTGEDWASRINPVLEQISNENRIALMNQCARVGANLESVEKYVVSNDAPATTTGTLKVAMECAYAPFNWTQTDNKNGAVPIYSKGSEGLFANGFDVQIAKYVANALGLKLEIYACEWDSLIPGIQSETYDLIAAGMSPTADRRASDRDGASLHRALEGNRRLP